MPRKPIPESETRTLEQLREHYELEKKLANKLLRVSSAERLGLYTEVYDELYRTITDHPRNQRRHDPRRQTYHVENQMRYLRPFLRSTTHFLEVGPGDCAVSFEVARFVEKVYGVDVSAVAAIKEAVPENFELAISDGCSVPVAPNSVHLAFSNQLMEHLHPEDARAQLQNIHRALAPGGRYIVRTPHRLYGPHDISKYFDDIATGFHLREYTINELTNLLHASGFGSVRVLAKIRGCIVPIRSRAVRWLESFVYLLPPPYRAKVANHRHVYNLLRTITLSARKGQPT
jgi:SAM-dependent methyltransferase